MRKLMTRIKATWVLAFFLLCSLGASAQSEEVVKNFKPLPLWKHFLTLCATPRCSNNELQVAQLIIDLAVKNHLFVMKDSFNNVLVRIPPSPEFQYRPSVCLQGHIDMVCQAKSGNPNDIFPIILKREGDMLRAKGTTLGADDGIGVSALMALMSEPGINHCPLELLFTTGEEIGLIGANGFNYALLKSNIIDNVDSEEDGVLTVGCAGGAVMQITVIPKFFNSEKIGSTYLLKLSGFTGGHSGADINRGRGNAIKVMAALLSELKNFDLVSLSGGSAINTIPREAEATIFASGDGKKFTESLAQLQQKIASEFPLEKPLFSFQKTSNEEVEGKAMKTKSKNAVLSLLAKLPNGVLQMEHVDTALVRTSNNIGVVTMNADTVFIKSLFRSSSNKQIDSVKKVIEHASTAVNAHARMLARFSPWEPQFDSPVVRSTAQAYLDLFNKPMRVQTIHAGLECAVIFEHLPDAHIVSFGPNVYNAHTPDESVGIQSVENFWNFLLALLVK